MIRIHLFLLEEEKSLQINTRIFWPLSYKEKFYPDGRGHFQNNPAPIHRARRLSELSNQHENIIIIYYDLQSSVNHLRDILELRVKQHSIPYHQNTTLSKLGNCRVKINHQIRVSKQRHAFQKTILKTWKEQTKEKLTVKIGSKGHAEKNRGKSNTVEGWGARCNEVSSKEIQAIGKNVNYKTTRDQN